MARWKLTAGHYLNITDRPGGKITTEWEYREITNTGRSVRKIFKVPMYLNPDIEDDCNYPGECVVSDGNNPQPKDYIFLGNPTPDMFPLDPEAEAISAELGKKWIHPIDGIGEEGYGGVMMNAIMNDLAAFKASATPVSAVPNKELTDAVSAMAKLMEQNAAILAKLTDSQTRRV